MTFLTSIVCCDNQTVLDTIALKSAKFGQVTRVGVYKQGASIAVADVVSAAALALSQDKADVDKLVISPIVHNPTPQTGGVKTYGSGNSVNGGVPILVGRDPSGLDLELLNAHQATAAAFGKVSCSGVGVIFWDRCGNALGIADDVNTPTTLSPIPLSYLFVSALELGGLESPNKNMMNMVYKKLNWSEEAAVIAAGTFSPTTDLLD